MNYSQLQLGVGRRVDGQAGTLRIFPPPFLLSLQRWYPGWGIPSPRSTPPVLSLDLSRVLDKPLEQLLLLVSYAPGAGSSSVFALRVPTGWRGVPGREPGAADPGGIPSRPQKSRMVKRGAPEPEEYVPQLASWLVSVKASCFYRSPCRTFTPWYPRCPGFQFLDSNPTVCFTSNSSFTKLKGP